MEPQLVKLSKFLSLVLRHQPEVIGLALDDQGWADVDELLRLANVQGTPLTRPLLERIVETNDKRRFALSEDGTRIRANQGHSVEIDLALPPVEPPILLFHGTATRFLESIRVQGLIPGSRQHVHLSPDHATAVKVGRRHGVPAVLSIRAGEMHHEGMAFFRSENGVWLTAHVPVRFIDFESAAV